MRKSVFLNGIHLYYLPLNIFDVFLILNFYFCGSPGMDWQWAPCGLLDLWILLHTVFFDGCLPELCPQIHHPHWPHWIRVWGEGALGEARSRGQTEKAILHVSLWVQTFGCLKAQMLLRVVQMKYLAWLEIAPKIISNRIRGLPKLCLCI